MTGAGGVRRHFGSRFTVPIQRRKAGRNRGKTGPSGVASREHSEWNQQDGPTVRLSPPPPPHPIPRLVAFHPDTVPGGVSGWAETPYPGISRRLAQRAMSGRPTLHFVSRKYTNDRKAVRDTAEALANLKRYDGVAGLDRKNTHDTRGNQCSHPTLLGY